MPLVTYWIGPAGREGLSIYHRHAATVFLKSADGLPDAISPRKAANLLNDEKNFLVLAYLDEQCIGTAVFRPAAAHLLLLVSAKRCCGLGRGLLAAVKHVCAQQSHKELCALTPKDMPPATRKALHRLGFSSPREPPSDYSGGHPWKEAAELTAQTCPLTAADKLPTEATWLLKEATKLLANNDNGDLNLEETPSASQSEVQPHTGSLIALWVALDKHFYAARVRGRRAVVDERSGRPSYTLHVRYYDTPEECRPPHASPLPPQREERSVDGAKLIRSMEPPQRSSQRTWYPLAAMPSSRDWLGILWEAAMSQMGVSEEEEVQVRAKAAFERAFEEAFSPCFSPQFPAPAPAAEESASQESVEENKEESSQDSAGGLTQKPKPKKLKELLNAAFKKEEMQGLCDELEVAYLKKDPVPDLVEKLVKRMRPDFKAALETLKIPTLKSMLAAQSLKVGGKKEELVDRVIEAAAPPKPREGGGRPALQEVADPSNAQQQEVEPSSQPQEQGGASSPLKHALGASSPLKAMTMPSLTSSQAPPSSGRRRLPWSSGLERRRRQSNGVDAIAIDVDATPPVPNSWAHDSPAKPIWWVDDEDDERAAELLYTLFDGRPLEKDIEAWVLKDHPVAMEVFPHMEFWRELDIRWLRYSFAHAGVGEALRKLKQRFVEGKGKMRYVGLEMGDGDLGRPRQKRARRGGAEADSETTGCLLARLEIC